MIDLLNRLARKAMAKKGLSGRIFAFLREYCWIFKEIFLEYEIAEPLPEPTTTDGDPSIVWRTATPADLIRMADEGGYGIARSMLPYYHYLIDGRNFMMLGSQDGGQNDALIAYACILYEKKVFTHWFFPLRDDEGFILACYTKADCRGRGLGTQALRELIRHAVSQRSTRRFFSHVDTVNDASLKMFEKTGFRPAGIFLYRIRVLNIDFVFPRGKHAGRLIRQKSVRQPEKPLPTAEGESTS